MSAPTVQACLGYDDQGKPFDCPNPAGTPWTPYWCDECDARRRARISTQLTGLLAAFGDTDGGETL